MSPKCNANGPRKVSRSSCDKDNAKRDCLVRRVWANLTVMSLSAPLEALERLFGPPWQVLRLVRYDWAGKPELQAPRQAKFLARPAELSLSSLLLYFVIYSTIRLFSDLFSTQLVMVCPTQFQLRDPLKTYQRLQPRQNLLANNSSRICLKDSDYLRLYSPSTFIDFSSGSTVLTTWVTHGPAFVLVWRTISPTAFDLARDRDTIDMWFTLVHHVGESHPGLEIKDHSHVSILEKMTQLDSSGI